MGKIFFLCGPHASGKTSLLRELKAKGIVEESYGEIGKELFYERRLETEGQNIDFEREVVHLEIERDKKINKINGIALVETWHPGNLAYAAVRNPGGLREIIDTVNKLPYIKEAFGIWLTIPKEEIIKRTVTFKNNKQWAGEFYEKVNNNIGTCLKELGLFDRTRIVDANRDFTEVIKEVEGIIRSELY